jgi:hypothetical protein
MQEARKQDRESKEEERKKATDVAAVWGVPLTAVHCSRCGEAHLVPERALSEFILNGAEGAEGVLCPFCFQGPVTPQPAYLREEPPEQVLPYGVSEQQLTGILDRWTKGSWFRPAELKAGVLMQRVQRYLIPLWLVDGRVEAVWRADVGFDYQVVSYQDRYSDSGGWSSQEVKEGRVRWEPRVGRVNRTYENLAVPALDDHRALMDRLGDFDLSQRTGYSPEAVTGAAVRIPSLEPEAAWPGAEAAFARAAGAECRQAAGADHFRDFTLEAEYHDLNWTQLLLPAYVTWYREGDRVWPLLVNGQSGRVSGVRRASTRKANTTSLVLGGVALFLFLIGGLLALLGAALPPVAAVGGVLLIASLLLAVVAPIPAIGAWAFNRRSLPDHWR